MSFRGFAKAMARLPQQVKAKAGYAEETVDDEFEQLVIYYDQFKDFISKLKEDSQKFKKAMEAMLQHQRTFAATFLDVQAPIPNSATSINNSTSQSELLDANQKIKRVASDPEAAHAVQLYINSLDEVSNQISQDLTVIDRRVVQPIQDLQIIFRSVDRAILKRSHKLLDFDRHRNDLQRLKNATSKDVKDEKKSIQTETNFQVASQEFNAISDALKQQLPQFLQLRLDFIGPCFQTLYFLQMKIYQALLRSLEPVQQLQRYDFVSPMLTTYEKHRLQIDQLVDELTLMKPKVPTSMTSDQDPHSPSLVATSAPQPKYSSPPFAPTPATAPGAFPVPPAPAVVMASAAAAAAPVAAAPQPVIPPPVSGAMSARFVVAQFDFPGQQPDDLPFRVGDQIQVLEATASTNDWWKGQLHGKVGYFPANYVK